ncbi:MAG: esterase-like activity of phytase family protein [Sphingomonadales bacterium]|nr:MAG: esterase-like activity of phytase family protein [Sphingomonadales bacterium]
MKKALAALLFCLVPGSAGYPQAADVPVVATPVPIDPEDPAHLTIGRLRYLGGWQLTSRQRNFGGYSSLSVDGDRFFAVADTGDYMRFRMARPGVVSESRFGTLPALPAYSGSRRDRDSESMTIGPEGDIWIGFEHHNAILRYDRDLTQLTSMAWPPAMKDWSGNSGPEAMARLEGGRFAVFAEGAVIAPQVHEALMFPGDPTNPKNVPFAFGYRPPPGYAPTDAQQLPDGRIIILNRHFAILDGFWSALTIVDTRQIVPGAVVSGELVAELKPPLNIDNMEGISVVREGNRTVLWLISDDNQVSIERTLLLKFALEDAAR